MLKSLFEKKSLIFAGLAYLILAILHIPDSLFPHAFDKNAPVQLLVLLVIAAVFSIQILFKSERFRFPKFINIGAGVLILSLFSSMAMSGNLMGSLVGDSGRFVGIASTLSLLAVSLFHSQFSYGAFIDLMKFYLVAVEVVVVLGLAQHFNLIELPGDQGVTSTLGNTDFFAAYVGTTLPLLLLLAIEMGKRWRFILAIGGILNIYALYLAGPLQGFLDIAFVIVGIAILSLRKFIPRRNWSLNVRTFLGTFALIIWAEFIFLMPFLGDFIPVLGNDVQVKIRSNFWLAGMRQFFSHPLLGVGPDQYGNYYEHYRTLEDVQKFPNILSNDAHSASVQTLATLGLIGTLAFVFLLAIVIRSILLLWDSHKFDRRALFLFSLFIFIYLTNSFVSPFTLSHKFLLWAICGFLVGQAYRLPSWKSERPFAIRVTAISGAALFIAVATIFTQAQLNYLNNVENYADKSARKIEFSNSSVLPCFMYFDTKLLIAKSVSAEAGLKLALSEIEAQPRCVAARIEITKNVVNSGDMTNLQQLIYRLYDLAPARAETLSFGMYYANRAGDLQLKATLEKALKALGLVYVPGKLG